MTSATSSSLPLMRNQRALGLITVCLVVLASCGGDDAASPNDPAATVTSGPSSDPQTVETTATPEPPDTQATTTSPPTTTTTTTIVVVSPEAPTPGEDMPPLFEFTIEEFVDRFNSQAVGGGQFMLANFDAETVQEGMFREVFVPAQNLSAQFVIGGDADTRRVSQVLVQGPTLLDQQISVALVSTFVLAMVTLDPELDIESANALINDSGWRPFGSDPALKSVDIESGAVRHCLFALTDERFDYQGQIVEFGPCTPIPG